MMKKLDRLTNELIKAAPSLVLVILAMLAVFFPEMALAEEVADGKLPYEKGMKTFHESMTGTVPFVISLVGIIACGAMLIFGGEISGFMRTMVFIILVVAVIVQAGSVVELLGGKKNLFTAVSTSLWSREGQVA